ncbi:pilus assembly PilX family protein [Dyella sp.]|jgi:type IV pilus assembly protein PilX|uniref:pilus assembly PilX family protein n=1 Tax=Dyella sp. TaxID=1869338 RepID=UPI002C976570|nr:PilX N-terminal domain-containing pilus assembly protein [Dyella sp.]HTC26766.1 PilX N-terminal domain-containing pilus assembly protein [Dyella sp.]
MNTAKTYRFRKERGFVLIASMFMLIILTLLAVGMYHSFTLQENMTSNIKEKGRAFQIAQSTLQYGEYQLATNLAQLPVSPCTAAPTPITQVTICTTTAYNIQSPTAGNPEMSLTNATQYQSVAAPFDTSFTTSQTGGSATSNDNLGVYYDYPQLYIQYLGLSPDGQSNLYQVTALAYGANANSVAAVQSTYALTAGVKNLGGL